MSTKLQSLIATGEGYNLEFKENINSSLGRERGEKLELLEDSLREALINALVHRDYFSNGHIQIDIFSDRVEISNPGRLVSGLSKKDFGKKSFPRNPLLMDLMLRIRKVEQKAEDGRLKSLKYSSNNKISCHKKQIHNTH